MAISALRSAWASLSSRDRSALLILFSALALTLVVGFWWWTSSALQEFEEQRSQTISALRTLRAERSRIAQRQAQRDAVLLRYATRAPALTSFLEGAAREANITVAEATDRVTPPATGSRFSRRSVVIRLRQVDLQSLVNFMARIDAAPFPIAITGIRIRKHFGASNSWDVDDMVISTWDRVESAGNGRSGSNRSGSGSGASAGAASGAGAGAGSARAGGGEAL